MVIHLSAKIGALIGAMLCVQGLVTIYAATWRPEWLDHVLLRPRWFSSVGPRAGPVGATIGAMFWVLVGAWMIYRWVHSP